MQAVTAEQIRNYLDARRGCTFAAIYAVTLLKMNKTGNPHYNNVVHIWGRNVTFGANYENSVNRRWAEAGEAEDYFQAEQLWKGKGERINSYMARHVDSEQEYLVYQLRTNADGIAHPPLWDEYRIATTGEQISLEELEQWLPSRNPSRKQRVESLPCRETFPRTVKINGGKAGIYDLGLVQINIDNDTFLLTETEQPAIS